MKKFLIAILAFIYLGVSSGIAMNVRYCMGKISSVDLMHSSNKCGKCGMKMDTGGGCCKDEFKIVKLSDSHKIIYNEINISAPVVILDNHYCSFNAGLILSEISCQVKNNSPPQSQETSLCVLHCVFRI